MSEEFKDMSRQSEEKKPAPKKFNFYWIYAIVAVLLFATYFFPTDFAKETDFNTVEKMILSKEIDHLEVVNNELVNVYLTKEAIESPKYKDLKQSPLSSKNEGPHYHFTLPDASKSLKNDIDTITSKNNLEKINIIFKTKQNWGREAHTHRIDGSALDIYYEAFFRWSRWPTTV
jgi:AFG3 family protein